MKNNKITPFLWFNKGEAAQAALLYDSVFKDAKVEKSSELNNTPSGDVQIIPIEIFGHNMQLMSAGPEFKFNPSISFLVACDSKEEVDGYWTGLAEGGMPLMEIGSYPFSQRYGWIQDKFGVSWQLMYMGDRKGGSKITPTLMFTGDVCGRAEEAINFYRSVFHDTSVDHIMRYEKGEAVDKEGTIKHAAFTLEGQMFAAMDSAYDHKFKFNEAISFIISCKDQAELNYYWNKLSAVPEAEQCGWLKDKFGVSWQVTPSALDEMMSRGTKEQVHRVTQAFLKMKKFDIAKLEDAFNGKS